MDIKTERRVVEAFRSAWKKAIAADEKRDRSGRAKAEAHLDGMRDGLRAAGVEPTLMEWRGWSMAYGDMGYEWQADSAKWGKGAAACSR